MARQVTIIGGGFAGAAAAIQLARQAPAPLEITIVEPRAQVGAGLAYSNADPAVRLNVEDSLMVADVQNISGFAQWLVDSGTRARDPEGEDGTGQFYARRCHFAQFMAQQFELARAGNASGSVLRHVRDRAIALTTDAQGHAITLDSGIVLRAGLVILALGNDSPASLPALLPDVAAHPAYIPDAWAKGALDRIAPDARVLLVGTGLTAVDVVASLDRRGHAAPITMISRRGLMPRAQGAFPGIAELLRRNTQPVPIFIQQHGTPDTLMDILRWLRADVAAATARGEPWHDAFDAVRDAAKHLWPALSTQEKQRFFRHLRPFYDCHRFRVAPQIHGVVQRRMAAGLLTLDAARLVGLHTKGDALQADIRPRHATQSHSAVFDAVINCTGPNQNPARSGIALFQSSIAQGVLATDKTGVGLAVNESCETLRADGTANRTILAIGPMTKGRFAETVAVPQIALQLAALTGRLGADDLI